MKSEDEIEYCQNDVSLPVRGAWIEMQDIVDVSQEGTSLPVRGAWIEMHYMADWEKLYAVAPRAGSVD